MSDIYVFSSKESDNNYSTMGLACALVPTECTFEETANGESAVNLTHPLDEYGRYNYLVNGNILVVPVPVRTTPEIKDGAVVTKVWKYKVKPLDQLTSKSQRTLYKNKTGGGTMKILNAGEAVTVVEIPIAEGNNNDQNQRWKVKSAYGTGWIDQNGIVLDKEVVIDDNSKSIEDVQAPWTVMPQYFRIFEVKKSLTDVKVTARHITYDLLYNLTQYKSEGSVTLQTALDDILKYPGHCMAEHPFHAYTNVANERAGLNYDNINPIDIFMNEETGLCALYEVNIVRDNYNIYFLHDPGINRGIRISYAKNMTGVDFTSSEDEVVTRIVPVGETKDGKKLYLDDSAGTLSKTLRKGDRGTDVKSLQRLLIQLGYNVGSTGADGSFGAKTEAAVKAFQTDNNLTADGVCTQEVYTAMLTKSGMTFNGKFVDSPRINDYPVVHIYELKCDNCKVGESDQNGGTVTEEVARARMREQAQKQYEQEIDKPKIEMSVEFVSLGDTEEYKQFKNLENCFLFDYVTVEHPRLGIDILARITKIEWDCIRDRMISSEIGEVKKNLATSGITTWQIPSGVSGSKLAEGSVSGTQIAQDTISARHIQADSINADKINADSVTTRILQVIQAKFEDLDADTAHIATMYAQLVEATTAQIKKAIVSTADIEFADVQELAANYASIVTANLNTANIKNASIDWAKITTLASEIARIANVEIGKASISTAQIKDLTTEVARIADAEISKATITTAQISDLNTEVATIAKAQLTTANINNASIDWAKISNLAAKYATVVNGKITNANIDFAKVDNVKITSADVGKISIDGAVIGDGTITTAHIKNADVDWSHVKNAQIEAADITSINADVITSGTLATERLIIKGADGLIYEINAEASGLTKEELTDDKYKNLLNGTVIVAKSVTADQIAAGTITGAEIKAGTLTTNHVSSDFGATLDLSSNTGIDQRVEKIYEDMDAVATRGRNLALGTAKPIIMSAAGVSPTYYLLSDYGYDITDGDTTGDYTISMDWTFTWTGEGEPAEITGDPYFVYRFGGSQTWGSRSQEWPHITSDKLSGRVESVVRLSEAQAARSTKYIEIRLRATVSGYTLTVSNLKFEKGTRATEWTEAPEEAEDALETQLQSINARISNMGESIQSEVRSNYALKSDLATTAQTLQTLSEQTQSNFTWSVSQINQLMGKTEGLTEEQARARDTLTTMLTYMRFDQNGMTIGKSGSELTLRATNDRLSFYSNETEVAYISNNKLFITEAQILTRMTLGRFGFEPQQNGNLSLIFNG